MFRCDSEAALALCLNSCLAAQLGDTRLTANDARPVEVLPGLDCHHNPHVFAHVIGEFG